MALIFISGANITIGGPLEIYHKVLNTLSDKYPNHQVVAIVSEKKLFFKYNNVHYVECKKYKKFILLKFYYEYVRFFFLSKKYNVDLWLSLNDCTPTVKAKVRAVYCHNATPFYKRTYKDYLKPSRPFLQSFYYIIFYRINLKFNNYIIVQQSWIKDFFVQKLKVPKSKVIINRVENNHFVKNTFHSNEKHFPYTFIYPTKSQSYKNIEVILEAADILTKMNVLNFRILLTISNNENLYSNSLSLKYKHLKNVFWIGFLTKSDLNDLYANGDCLIFSSKMETWGLPISEFKNYKKPILASNLPYAHETVGDFNLCKFFNPNDPTELSNYMNKLINNDNLQFDKSNFINDNLDVTNNFNDLFDILIHN